MASIFKNSYENCLFVNGIFFGLLEMLHAIRDSSKQTKLLALRFKYIYWNNFCLITISNKYIKIFMKYMQYEYSGKLKFSSG